MLSVEMIASTSLRPLSPVLPRAIAITEELVGVLVAFDIVTLAIIEFPEIPYHVPIPEPKMEGDDVVELVAAIVAFEMVEWPIVELPK
jgi:hypothetical protein